MSDIEMKEQFYTFGIQLYKRKENELGINQIREIERIILLKIVDTKWIEHIDAMEHLKQGIGLQAYRQVDPVQAYQIQGSEMFDKMISEIKFDTLKYLFNVRVERGSNIQAAI